jgi:hypothetical protein
LYAGAEVDLINFENGLHGSSCELIAQAFDSEFQLARVPGAQVVYFRKKADWFDRSGSPGQVS